MAKATLAEMIAAAAVADGPRLVPPLPIATGGVDPLGLRQINFDMMDRVLPGLNNVARHIRPFVMVAWAWKRAVELAKRSGGAKVDPDLLQDFVDRIEVVYAGSQILRSPDAEVPGRQALASFLAEPEIVFFGERWAKLRKDRRYSTAISAPVNYGPGLKSLGWVVPHPDDAHALAPSARARPAVAAFEALIAERLEHPIFGTLGDASISHAELTALGEVWPIGQPTEAEAEVARALLSGEGAPLARRRGCALVVAAAAHAGAPTDLNDQAGLRVALAGSATNFVPPADLDETRERWRRLQTRQAFRFALESLLHWIVVRLADGRPRSTSALVDGLLESLEGLDGLDGQTPTGDWLAAMASRRLDPVAAMRGIREAFDGIEGASLERSVVAALGACLADAPERAETFERDDRLPLVRAKREANARADEPLRVFLAHVIESWVLAQHVYWSVGRGLADARAGAKTILRLRVVLDEAGWTLTAGTAPGGRPNPTPDRLRTAIGLLGECGAFALAPAAEARPQAT